MRLLRPGMTGVVPASRKAGAEAIGVIGAVGDQAADRAGPGDQLGGDADVGVVAGGEVQGDRSAEQVGDQVELGVAATAG